MRLERITAPAASPLTLGEAKQWLRVDHDDDDLVIDALVAAATDRLDGTGLLGRAIVTQTWRQYEAAAPSDGWLELRMGPVQSLAAVSWVADDGTITSAALADYDLVRDGDRAWARSSAWPSGLAQRPDALQVDYVAGFGDAADVPQAIKTALLLLVAHWYEHREAVIEGALSEIPIGVLDLIERWRYGWAG